MTEGKNHPLNVATGAELRDARMEIGWTVPELAQKLDFRPHLKTLRGYESGRLQCPYPKLVELCEVLGTFAPALLARANERAENALPVRDRKARRALRVQRIEHAMEAARENPRRLALARRLQALFRQGMSPERIGAMIGKSEAFVLTHLAEADVVMRSKGNK